MLKFIFLSLILLSANVYVAQPTDIVVAPGPDNG
jgi:hypothetical protein